MLSIVDFTMVARSIAPGGHSFKILSLNIANLSHEQSTMSLLEKPLK